MEPHQRLATFRESLGLSRKEMAAKLSTAYPSYHNIETGRNGISPRALELMKIKYSLNPEWMMTGVGSMVVKRKDSRDLLIDELRAENASLREDLARNKKLIDNLMEQVNQKV